MQQLAEEFCERPELFLSLRHLIVAGEQPIITRPLAQLLEQLEHCAFHNLYGPSETHVATGFTLRHPPQDWPQLPPIGRPIANAEIYVLDSEMQPAPAGVAGEVYIGGDGLARGYLKHPALTADKFVPHPFAARPGARLYRTGDLARHLPDGNLKFLGRRDNQVKVRGFRIELGEVEAVISRHPSVRDAVVVAREDAPGEKRLVAYVVAEPGGAAPAAGELRRFVLERLPDYMAPSAFVPLDVLPHLPNGKIDRRALPAPQTGLAQLGGDYVPPRTPSEKTLAEIWARTLRLDAVGVNDNFMELGGDSILSFQVVARANRAGLNLNLKEFYDHPTVAEQARLAEASAPAAPRPAAPTRPELLSAGPGVADSYALSPLQQGMLFHDLSDPSAREYVEVVCFDAPQRLEPESFERAWRFVVERHPALRTAFDWEEFDEPVQVVYESVSLKFERHDWSGLAAGEQSARFEAYVAGEQRRAFDLSAAPLWSLSLIKFAADAYQFVWSYKHLILDGWSRGLVLRELGEAYHAFASGGEPRAGDAPAFRRYVEWLRRQDMGQAESFWRRSLGGLKAPTAFALEASRVAEEDDAPCEPYAEERLQLSAKTTEGMRRLARGHGLTLNTVAQGAWALLLSRYTGQRHVVFGTVVSGRPVELEGAEEMVGLLINTLPVRVEVDEGLDVLTWLRGLQVEAATARQYEYSPLAEVRRWAGAAPGAQLFESIIVFGNHPGGGEDSWAFADRSLQRTGYPIQVLFEPGPRLSLRLTYSTRRFDEAGVRRLLGHYEAAAESLLAHAGSRVADLSVIGERERRRLLLEFNETATGVSLERCFHEHFEEQSARTPDAVAVVCGDEEVTYAELNARANGVACVLAERGVGPDMLVALLAERGVAFLTAVLGVFKAGGAYLPLDPRHPARRGAEVLEQSRAPFVLTSPELAPTLARAVEHLPDGARPQTLSLAEAFARGTVDENPPPRSGPRNLAYVIYTSGSTGRPKGAMVEQSGMLNHLFAKVSALSLTAADEVAQTASQCFDISVWQFLAPLVVGGRTHVIGDELVHDPARLLEHLRQGRVTVVETVPSLLRMVVEEVAGAGAASSPLGGLRWMIPTGEALPPELARRWFDAHPHVPLLNAYGPTECSDDVSHHLIRRPPPVGTVNMPIGRPVANTRLYVLGEGLRPVPAGQTGELYVGGAGVGRGYLHDPRRTAERFVPDPFSAEPGARLYRTGDLARHLPDDNLEFLGRRDNQVKVRGFRIELGDIEAALVRHPEVSEAVVVVREEPPGDKRLAAYVVPRPGSAPGPDELHAYLRERLPDYMTPSAFVLLEAMPLTPNGKLDRRRLPAATYSAPAGAEESPPPRNATERTLARVWGEVLGVERVGVNDNFFRLGGDSILSLQVVAKARQAGLRLSPAQLFSHQTVAALAEVVTAAAEVTGVDASSPVAAPLTPIQHWFFEQDYPDPHHWNQSVMLQAREPLSPALVERAVRALVAHHNALRLRFVRSDEGWEQRLEQDPPTPFTFEDLSGVAPDDEQLSMLRASASGLQAGLDLMRGPLMRAGLFRLGEGRGDRLLLTIHHLAVDGVSWRILLEDLQTAYRQLARGEAVSLPPQTTGYTRWAVGLAEHASSEEVRAEAAYWLGAVEARHAPLPLDYPEGENTVASARVVSVELDDEETRRLLRDVPAASHTGINDVLLAALLKAVGPWTGDQLLFVNLEGHGREEVFGGADLSRTVGWFTALFPVSLSARGQAAGELLRSVREQLRSLPHKGLGYGLLRYLSLDAEVAARLRAAPRPEISFNYLGQFDQALADSGLFAPAREPAGPNRSGLARRGSVLDVAAVVTGGRLRVDWHFSENLHRGATVETLARDYLAALRELIAHCLTRGAVGLTPADFPLAALGREELGRLSAEVVRSDAARHGLAESPPAEVIEDIYRLSPLQHGILFDLRFAPESGAYAMQLALTLRGALDAEALKRALQQTVARHSILRTSFHWEGLDEPVQVVRRRAPMNVCEADWRGLSRPERAGRLDEYLRADRRRGFDLGEAPLMRVSLLRTGEDEHEFVWSWHHLIVDGWSFSLLLKEIIALYNGLCEGREVRLRPARQYAEYIRWLERQELARAESFWRSNLGDLAGPTALADGGRRPAPGDAAHAEQSLELSRETTEGMRRLARGHGLTLNTVAQGAWALLLSRYTGQRHVVFGTAVSGRAIDLAGVEEMVGLLINTLPVRVEVDEGLDVLTWLRGLQAEAATARQYEYSPLAEVRRWAGAAPGAQLFESLLVFKNIVTGDLEERRAGGVEVTNPRAEHKTGYPLHISAEPGERFVFVFTYETAHFSDALVGRVLRHLGRLIEDLVSDPRRPLAELSLLTEEEQRPQAAFGDLADLEDE